MTFEFYYCTACGAMSMHNFRDDHCRVCGVAMEVNKVTIEGLILCPTKTDEPAPHA